MATTNQVIINVKTGERTIKQIPYNPSVPGDILAPARQRQKDLDKLIAIAKEDGKI